MNPFLKIDALALTIKEPLPDDLRYLGRRFITLSRRAKKTTDQNEFSTNRYRRAIRLQMEPGDNGIFDSTKPWLLIQTEPRNTGNDSPLQIELKAFPYEDKHFVTAGETIKYLLGIDTDDQLDVTKLMVTRIDIAIDVRGDLDSLLLHKSRTRVSEESRYLGKLRCIRLGRSKGRRYVVIYGKKWRPSRHSPLVPSGILRIEIRNKPRTPLSEVIDALKLDSFLSDLYLYDMKRIERSGIFDAQTLLLCKHFGLTPIVMSNPQNTRKRLLRYLRRFRVSLLEDEAIKRSKIELQRQLDLLCN